MDTQIGEAAGRIWHYLAEHGETTLRQLQRGTLFRNASCSWGSAGSPAKTNSAWCRSVGS